MKSKLCPYKKHCHSAGDCENCDFGKAFVGLQKRITRLKNENESLKAENKYLKNRIEDITNPCF
jgi:cell division protein FtsB